MFVFVCSEFCWWCIWIAKGEGMQQQGSIGNLGRSTIPASWLRNSFPSVLSARRHRSTTHDPTPHQKTRFTFYP